MEILSNKSKFTQRGNESGHESRLFYSRTCFSTIVMQLRDTAEWSINSVLELKSISKELN